MPRQATFGVSLTGTWWASHDVTMRPRDGKRPDAASEHARGHTRSCRKSYAYVEHVGTVVVVTNDELIDAAAAVLRPHVVGDRLFGNVAACLVTSTGVRHFGVCIDTGSGTGFCAEHAAIASMVTAGEYAIDQIVAVWRDDSGTLFALPPCGRCREFIRQIDHSNLGTYVVLGSDRALQLRDLLPEHSWPVVPVAEPPASP